MIFVDVPARMKCEEAPRPNELSISLVMTISGGFALRPPDGHGWQISAWEGLFLSRCPEHRKLIAGEPQGLVQ